MRWRSKSSRQRHDKNASVDVGQQLQMVDEVVVRGDALHPKREVKDAGTDAEMKFSADFLCSCSTATAAMLSPVSRLSSRWFRGIPSSL